MGGMDTSAATEIRRGKAMTVHSEGILARIRESTFTHLQQIRSLRFF